jgi:hypothetical protein
MPEENGMGEEIQAAAARLDDYLSALSTDAEADYPAGHDPAEDARTVREFLGG